MASCLENSWGKLLSTANAAGNVKLGTTQAVSGSGASGELQNMLNCLDWVIRHFACFHFVSLKICFVSCQSRNLGQLHTRSCTKPCNKLRHATRSPPWTPRTSQLLTRTENVAKLHEIVSDSLRFGCLSISVCKPFDDPMYSVQLEQEFCKALATLRRDPYGRLPQKQAEARLKLRCPIARQRNIEIMWTDVEN